MVLPKEQRLGSPEATTSSWIPPLGQRIAAASAVDRATARGYLLAADIPVRGQGRPGKRAATPAIAVEVSTHAVLAKTRAQPVAIQPLGRGPWQLRRAVCECPRFVLKLRAARRWQDLRDEESSVADAGEHGRAPRTGDGGPRAISAVCPDVHQPHEGAAGMRRMLRRLRPSMTRPGRCQRGSHSGTISACTYRCLRRLSRTPSAGTADASESRPAPSAAHAAW